MLAELGRDADLYVVDATDRPGETERVQRNLLTAAEAGEWVATATGQRTGAASAWSRPRLSARLAPARFKPVPSATEVVAAYWGAANKRDWSAFADLVAENVVYEGPQARERVRGRDAYLQFNIEGFPGDWHLDIVRIVGGDREAASWIRMTYPDGTAEPGVCFFELDEKGLIARITDFWPLPYELPAPRSHLVERF